MHRLLKCCTIFFMTAVKLGKDSDNQILCSNILISNRDMSNLRQRIFWKIILVEQNANIITNIGWFHLKYCDGITHKCTLIFSKNLSIYHFYINT